MIDTMRQFEPSQFRALPLQRRADLTVVEQTYRQEAYWLIKDPLALAFCCLNQEEFALLEMLDGRSSIEQIRIKFHRRFPTQRITPREIQAFIADAHQKSLLAYHNQSIGSHLLQQAKEKERENRKERFSGLMVWRPRGIDPDQFLNWATPKLGWLFSRPAVVCSLLLMSCAAFWILVHWNAMIVRLPELGEFCGKSNWIILGCVILTMKLCHELAHGICIKRFGGECHELGVIFLLLFPTLYCNTSDSWMLRDKWKRAAIGAAGMYIELLIAALAVFGWWYSQPGIFNMACLNMVVAGTISVVICNANPFLKFDGYYIVSDILELPNLRERSRKLAHAMLLRYTQGIEHDLECHSRTATKSYLIMYHLGACLFRILLAGMIVFLLIDRFSPIGLSYMGFLLGLIFAGRLLFAPLVTISRGLRNPILSQKSRSKNAFITIFTFGSLMGVFCVLPIPQHVVCPFTIRPRSAITMFVEHDAVLDAVYAGPGETLKQGDRIADFKNHEIDLELTRLVNKESQLERALHLSRKMQGTSTENTARLVELEESLRTLRARKAEIQKIANSFHLVAPQDGTVLPERIPPLRVAEELPTWDGAPLEEHNIGVWLARGQRLCTLGDMEKIDAVLVVNEYDIRYVTADQPVTLMIDSIPGLRWSGSIHSVARKETTELPESLATRSGGTIKIVPAKATGQREATDSEFFEALVRFPKVGVPLSSGLRGYARIYIGERSLLELVTQKFHRAFRRKL